MKSGWLVRPLFVLIFAVLAIAISAMHFRSENNGHGTVGEQNFSHISPPDAYELNIMAAKMEICGVPQSKLITFEDLSDRLTISGEEKIESLMSRGAFVILPQKVYIEGLASSPSAINRSEIFDRSRAVAMKLKLSTLGLKAEVIVGLYHNCEGALAGKRRVMFLVQRPSAEQVFLIN